MPDILHAIVLDSEAINYTDFEDWADSLGHDSDSQSVERMYDVCLETGLKLRAGLGEEKFDQLHKLFQDY